MGALTLPTPTPMPPAARWWPPLEAAPSTPRGKRPDAAQRLAQRSADLSEQAGDMTVAAQALRRALSRGDAVAEQSALKAGLLGAQAKARFTTPVLEAAWSLLNAGAATLAQAEQRHQALALAAAVWGASGRPCMVLTADDEAAAQALRVGAPLFEHFSLRAALAPSDAIGGALRSAYAAEIVYVPARRLAADLARDRRERGGGDASRLTAQLAGGGAVPLLTQGLHTLLVDEVDRVLFDDAVNPVMLSVPDDPTLLGPAIAAACALVEALQAGRDYELDETHGLRWTPAGLLALPALSASLPALWRTTERGELLFAQALVARDLLQRGRDYALVGNGQVHLDDSVLARLPDRALISNLTLALQVRLQLPRSPITRATDRSSVLSLVGGAHRLGGLSANLDGLAAPLWSRHGLCVDAPSKTAAAWPCMLEPLASEAVWKERLQKSFDVSDVECARLYVLRHITDASQFAGLPGAQGQAWVLAGLGPARAIGALLHGEALVPRRLEIIFTEPLDSARAEAAFLCRAADSSGLPVEGRVLLQPRARSLTEALGDLAQALAWLCGRWPSLSPRLIKAALRLLRWRSARQQSAALQAMALREQQLRLQLSFAGTAASAAPKESVDHSRRTP